MRRYCKEKAVREIHWRVLLGNAPQHEEVRALELAPDRNVLRSIAVVLSSPAPVRVCHRTTLTNPIQ